MNSRKYYYVNTIDNLYNIPPDVQELDICIPVDFTDNRIVLPSSLCTIRCVYNDLYSLPSLSENVTQLLCCDSKSNLYSSSTPKLVSLPAKLQFLHSNNQSISIMPNLPSSLTTLIIEHNRLTILPKLPPNLCELHCGFNKLTSLPSLPPSLRTLYCHENQLTHLSELPPSLETIVCHKNSLVSFPFDIPVKLGYIKCYGNKHLAHYENIYYEDLPTYIRTKRIVIMIHSRIPRFNRLPRDMLIEIINAVRDECDKIDYFSNESDSESVTEYDSKTGSGTESES